MIERVAFQTRARTVDHLGREQIADCPTAVSELWKNAFDAYARSVELNIYGGDEPVASIVDDGHGMSREEFVSRWLVVGTESKVTSEKVSVGDRNGLKVRRRQGQKGIGRLSCANLGPVLLLVTKRKRDPFVTSLIDWRLFENPFLNLADIHIPVVEFEEKGELFEELPGLIAGLSENIVGGPDKRRRERVGHAWAAYDEYYLGEHSGEGKGVAPSQEILTTLSSAPFKTRHFEQWGVWDGKVSHGTALLVSNINHDLRAQLGAVTDVAGASARTRFFETLMGFVDPFVDPSDPAAKLNDPCFSYRVRAWEDDVPETIVASGKGFDRHMLDGMEHQLEGTVDSEGVFRGRIKAFGTWLTEVSVIEPPKDLKLPNRADSFLGPFSIYIASMEFSKANTTHTLMEFERNQAMAKKYSGFMMFRDGLRVLPFGRTDNDFFEIESRRSMSAGREFWNHRQMFGRVSVTRDQNPNLKDKAGREGLLDNRAAKSLKALVSNILMVAARKYFGSASDVRGDLLPKIQAANKKQRASEARAKLRKRHRAEFRSRLAVVSEQLPAVMQEIGTFRDGLKLENDGHIADAQARLGALREQAAEMILPSPPSDIGSLEDSYLEYRRSYSAIDDSLADLEADIRARTKEVGLAKPRKLLEKQLARHASQIRKRINDWNDRIKELQRDEFGRIRELVEERQKAYESEAQPLLYRFDSEELSYSEVSTLLDRLKRLVEEKNREMFDPYVGALESLSESIDLEHLATFGMEELSELRTELERLNSLAQLGIAVEIVGHELQTYDEIIGEGLQQLPDKIRSSRAAKDIEFGYEGLTDQLRFLSPLRLAGHRVQRWITGSELSSYIAQFFGATLAKYSIAFRSTEEFDRLRVFDQQSRLYPVFINLVNNSIYWLGLSEVADKQILFDVVGSDKPEVVVSDNGPGIDPEAQSNLFTLFFTRKQSGGRGVGLYLSRANLAAGGHKIRFEPDSRKMPLAGANFLIEFRGAEFDAK